MIEESFTAAMPIETVVAPQPSAPVAKVVEDNAATASSSAPAAVEKAEQIPVSLARDPGPQHEAEPQAAVDVASFDVSSVDATDSVALQRMVAAQRMVARSSTPDQLASALLGAPQASSSSSAPAPTPPAEMIDDSGADLDAEVSPPPAEPQPVRRTLKQALAAAMGHEVPPDEERKPDPVKPRSAARSRPPDRSSNGLPEAEPFLLNLWQKNTAGHPTSAMPELVKLAACAPAVKPSRLQRPVPSSSAPFLATAASLTTTLTPEEARALSREGPSGKPSTWLPPAQDGAAEL